MYNITKTTSNYDSNFGGKLGTGIGFTSGGLIGSFAGYTLASSTSIGVSIGSIFLPGIGSSIGGIVGAVVGFTIVGVSGAIIGSEIGKNIEKNQNLEKEKMEQHSKMTIQDEILKIGFNSLESPDVTLKKQEFTTNSKESEKIETKNNVYLEVKDPLPTKLEGPTKKETQIKELSKDQEIKEISIEKTPELKLINDPNTPQSKHRDSTSIESPNFKCQTKNEPKTPQYKYEESPSIREKKLLFEKSPDSPRLLKKTLSFSTKPKKEDFEFVSSFEEIPNITSDLLKEFKSRNYVKPTSLQSRTISLILNSNKNLYVQSEEGRGRKSCFGTILYHHIDPFNDNLQGIFICHSIERCKQIYEYLIEFTKSRNLKICIFYENDDSKIILNNQLIIGCPEHISSLTLGKSISFKDVSILIIDKLENLVLEYGNIRTRSIRNKIDYIKKHIPSTVRYFMFSNTFQIIYDENNEETKKDRKLQEFLDKFVPSPKERILIPKMDLIFSIIHQLIVICKNEKDLLVSIHQVLDSYSNDKFIIYVNSIENLNLLKEEFKKRDPIIVTEKKDYYDKQFILSTIPLKGIENVSFIINYDIPKDSETYLERITEFLGINQRYILNYCYDSNDYQNISKNIKKEMVKISQEDLFQKIKLTNCYF